MLTYLHDIRNKLTIISAHATILSQKYGEEEILPIKTNLARVSEIINDAYRHLKECSNTKIQSHSTSEFVHQLDLTTEALGLLFPFEIQNEISEYKNSSNFNISFNVALVFQVIENAFDNSLRANSKKIVVRLFEFGNDCVYEIVDNGTGKSQNSDETFHNSSIIPHGIGKEIMTHNMESIGGKIEWTRRHDYSGMIVRLYFPKKS